MNKAELMFRLLISFWWFWIILTGLFIWGYRWEKEVKG